MASGDSMYSPQNSEYYIINIGMCDQSHVCHVVVRTCLSEYIIEGERNECVAGASVELRLELYPVKNHLNYLQR